MCRPPAPPCFLCYRVSGGFPKEFLREVDEHIGNTLDGICIDAGARRDRDALAIPRTRGGSTHAFGKTIPYLGQTLRTIISNTLREHFDEKLGRLASTHLQYAKRQQPRASRGCLPTSQKLRDAFYTGLPAVCTWPQATQDLVTGLRSALGMIPGQPGLLPLSGWC